METIQPVEVLWTLICVIGLLFSAYNIYDALQDMHDVRLNDFNGRREAAIATARLSVASESLRGTKQLMLFVIGVVALSLPPEDTIGSAHPEQRMFIAWLFVVFAVLLTVNTIVTFFGRRRILRLVSQQEGGTHA
jgi:heme/copper-type cytochrome/quinol oxidase subunit 2